MLRSKVLFLVPSLAGGGAERVFTVLLRNLDRSRFEPHLGVLQASGSYTSDIPDDVKVHVLNVSRVRYAMPQVIQLVRRIRPQTILSTLGHLNLMLIFARPLLPRGTRLVIREAVASAAYVAERRPAWLWLWLLRRLYKRADRVVCLSDSLAEDMARNLDVPRHKTVRIYNPVDIRRVREMAEKAANPFPERSPKLVAAGRLTRQKGFDLLLDALVTVKNRFQDVHLTILGEGPLREELISQSQRLGLANNVDFAGFQANPWAYFKYADVFVFPSRFEGMPNVLLEALALGTYAVAADCPGGVAEIKGSDDLLVLIPTEDPEALASAILASCTQPRRPTESLEEAENRMKEFNVRGVMEEYSKLF